MNRLLLFIVLIIGLSIFTQAEDINECKIDVYYGNGVWNKYKNADKSRQELEKLIKKEIIQDKYGNVKLAYNWGQGYMEDLLETFYQLKENGQISEKTFFALVDELVAKVASDLTDVQLQKMREQIVDMINSVEESNIAEMWTKYYNESFKLGHRVLLVSHSQGNLFANRIYDTIDPIGYKNYFANFQVASPASEVKAPKGDYVTLYGDPIINPILGSMAANANGFPGHAFVEAYLNQSDPYEKIVVGIKQLLPTLDGETSQWETDQEMDVNTCDYKITVKHRFDFAVEMPLDVYPFAPSQKLYQVGGEYVKASCGGHSILDAWDGKKDNECLMIDNPPKEIISEQNMSIVITGESIKNECKVEQVRLSYYVDYWANWCYVGDPTDSWEWIGELKGCEFDDEDGEYLDQDVPQDWVIESERIIGETTHEVFNSIYRWGINAHYVKGTLMCYTTGGIYSFSKSDWVADVNKGYRTIKKFERVYVPERR